MQQTMKDGKPRVNFAFFCQLLLSPLNLTLVYQSCHDRDKKCECRFPCKNKGNCSCTFESMHSSVFSNSICTCPSIDERKIFLKKTGASSGTKTRLKKEREIEDASNENVQQNGDIISGSIKWWQ